MGVDWISAPDVPTLMWLPSKLMSKPRADADAMYASGAVPPFSPTILTQKGSLYLTRRTLGTYIARREDLVRTGRGQQVLPGIPAYQTLDPIPQS